MIESFLVNGKLFRLTWDEAEQFALRNRVKTSLALTRARSRLAMEAISELS